MKKIKRHQPKNLNMHYQSVLITKNNGLQEYDNFFNAKLQDENGNIYTLDDVINTLLTRINALEKRLETFKSKQIDFNQTILEKKERKGVI